MLYPSFEELIELRSKIGKLEFFKKEKSNAMMSGDYLSNFRGNGIDFDEVREYVVGDDIRRIDWKVTARAGTPHIKLFKEEKQLNIVISVDMNSNMQFGTRKTFKSVQAARCAAILGWYANLNNDNVGSYFFGNLLDNDLFIQPKSSRNNLWQMIKILSNKYEIKNKNLISISSSIKNLLSIKCKANLVFIISDFINIDEELIKQLSFLSKKSKVILISVNDCADSEIVPVGKISCLDGIGHQIDINTDDRNALENYTRQWLDNRKFLEKITNSLGVKMINVMTHKDVFYQLSSGLHNI